MFGFFACIVFFFAGKRSKPQKLRMWRSRQSYSLQIDVYFSHQCQKLWEKMHFYGQSAIFQGEVEIHRNTAILTMCEI